MSEQKQYRVWMRYTARGSDNAWKPTQRFVSGRTDKEANSRMRRAFKDAGFSSMSLVARLETNE